jgi:pimeloyl-ACP methyl ester carboxylesterase
MARERNSNRPDAAPMPLMLALEARALGAPLLALAASPILARAPKGDGHPVVVIPPFGAADQFTVGLRRFIGSRGYDVQGWGRSEILGLHRLVAVAINRVEEVHAKSGRLVSLVGHSLGGVYAREVARHIPDKIRCCVTLGSPSQDLKANYVWPMFEVATGTKVGSLPDEFVQQMRAAPPVPTTSIYSKSDAVVAWKSVVDRSPGQVENVEVPGSHIGLPFNPWALYVVADRLAQPEGEWRPFERSGMRGLMFRGAR